MHDQSNPYLSGSKCGVFVKGKFTKGVIKSVQDLNHISVTLLEGPFKDLDFVFNYHQLKIEEK